MVTRNDPAMFKRCEKFIKILKKSILLSLQLDRDKQSSYYKNMGIINSTSRLRMILMSLKVGFLQ